MNRHVRTPGSGFGGPTKATASTMCQKCLKRGHYSYECKSSAQERPYVSRPSRTQQLLNPKLVPKLTSDVAQDLLRKKGVADEVLAKAQQDRGRKRERQSEEPANGEPAKRMRSTSMSSVSTISTGISRSPSPLPAKSGGAANYQARSDVRRTYSPSPPPSAGSRQRSVSPRPRQSKVFAEKKRRRSSLSSGDSYSSREVSVSRERTSSRNTRRRFEERSPVRRGRRRSDSRSPFRPSRTSEEPRLQGRLAEMKENKPAPRQEEYSKAKPPARERSLSPFSKRLALTQAMNG